MSSIETKYLSVARDAIAPDGSDVRVLLKVDAASMAHFELAPGQTSVAVMHYEIEEVWYFLAGRGEMWRKTENGEETIVPVHANVCLTIPKKTHFQFRSFGYKALSAIGLTTPPWPEDPNVKIEDVVKIVPGKWTPTIESGIR